MWQLVRHSLRSRRRATMWFAVGMLLYAFLVMGLWPSYSEFDLTELYETLPEPLVKALVGDAFDRLGGAQSGFYQYLGSQLTTWLPLVLAYFGIWLGAGAIVREYDRHTRDVLLAQPLQRARFLLARFAAVGLSALPVVAVSAAGLGLGIALWGQDVELGAAPIVFMHIQLWLFTLATAGIGLLLGVLLLEPSRAYGLGAAVIVVMYVLNVVGSIASDAQWLGQLSLFGHWRPMDQLIDGMFGWREALVLGGVATVSAGAATALFRRRDIAT